MGFVKISAKLLAIIVLLTQGLAASGFENSGIGTTARGMAGAFRAIADDWTAAYYNPAGYAKIYDNQLGSNYALVHLRHELNPDYRFGDAFETGIFNNRTNYNKHEILSIPSGGFVVRLPFWGETVMGLSAYQPFDYNITWTLYDFPLAYNDSLTLPNNQFSNNLDVVAFQLTLAREFIEDKLSIGLGLQILRGDLIYTDIILRDNPYPPPLSVRPWDKVTEWNHNDGNGWGFGLNAGVLINVNEDLNLGITANIPFDLTINGTSKLEFYMPKNSTLIQNTDSADIRNLGTPGNLFASGFKIVDTADFETKLKLPSSIAFGVAYDVTEGFTVAFDAAYTFWSKYKGLNFTFTNHRGLSGPADTTALVRDFITSDLSNPADWNDAGKVMLGIKYKVSDIITFLAGGSADQSIVRKSSKLSPQLIDTGDKYTFSSGLIFHYRQWDFGMVTSYTSYPDLNINDLVDSDSDGLYDNFNGLFKGSTYETVLSFNYRF